LEETIQQHGLVSQETASAMAEVVRKDLEADFGIGITGVLGPSELEGKPAGQVYLAIAGAAGTKEFEFRIPPRRAVIKRRIANTALIELRRLINTQKVSLR
jgi:PncC family amidohydrolase